MPELFLPKLVEYARGDNGEFEGIVRSRDPEWSVKRDFCTQEGAEFLASKIRSYWDARGYHVDLNVTPNGRDGTMSIIRSNMQNGLPRCE